MDRITPEQRSALMSKVVGKGNKSTERRLVSILRSCGIKGWRRHLPLPGTPDFTFRQEKVCVFVDGCFWHGCPRCYSAPSSNRKYWSDKLDQNRRRDRRVSRVLRASGYSVLRFWECALKNEGAVASKIRRKLDGRNPGPKRPPRKPL